MKKITLIIFLFSLFTFGQNVVMQNGTFNQCAGTFTDSGGPSGTYGNNENFTITFCPTTPGDNVQLDFTAFSTQNNADILTIYNGPDTTFDLIGNYSGGPANSPGSISAMLELAPGGMQNPDGCLTIVFISNATGVTTGWSANISCYTPCQLITAEVASTNPTMASPTTVESALGDPITFNGAGTFSTSGAGATYLWNFGNGDTATGQSVTYTYPAIGIYNVTLTITDTSGCSSTNNINLQAIIGSTTVGNPNVDAGNDVAICAGECTTLDADFLEIGDTSTYTIEAIPFVPPFPFSGLANSINTNVDDRWSGVENLPFDFCFFLNTETQFQVGSNGVIRFDVDPGDTSNGYALGAGDNLPNNTNPTLGEANVFTPVHDINPAVNSTNEIRWDIIGTAPNRVLAVSFFEVPLFSCTSLEATHMAVMYETTNVIDIYVRDKPTCTTFNGGRAAIGIQNDPGTTAFVPPGRNVSDSPWTTTDEAWRFTPAGPDVYTFEWLDDTGAVISTNPNFSVCPTVTSTYTARVTYNNCNGDVVVVTDDVTVNVGGANANDLTIQQCSPNIDLDAQIPNILDAGTDASTVDVSFYNSSADANVPQNPITNTTNYTATDGEIIYVLVQQASSGCSDISELTILLMPPSIGMTNDLEMCDVLPNDGLALFDLTIQDADVLDGLAAANYNITYYASLSDANAGTPDLTSPYQNIGSPQPIFVRIEDVSDGSCFSVSSTPAFNLIVNPSDDGSFTVSPTCDGGTVTITGTNGGTFAFNPPPTDTAVIDPITGTVSNGSINTSYTIEYTTSGICPNTQQVTFTTSDVSDTAFTLAPTCDGATATVTGDSGGTFTFNPDPMDGAVIDAATGTITNGQSGMTYFVDYTIGLPCPSNTTQSVTVFPLEDASFTATPTCDGATVTVTGDAGGVFAFNPDPMDGSVIDPVTGTITSGTPSATYTIEYTTSGPCPESTTQNVTVLDSEDSTFTTTATCDGATAVITGDAGGVFAFNPVPTDGAVIDTATGTVTGATQGTTYTIEYMTSGPCPSTSTESFTVLSSNDTTFTLAPTCDGATATVTGDAGGTFTFNPVPTDGAVIDATTGTITNGTQGSTYTVEYSFTLPCPVSSTQSVTVFPLEDASFTTTPTCDGATVTVTGDAGGVFAFNPDPMDGSVIDPVTGTVTGGPPSATYTIEYTTTGPCPVQNTENVTVFAEETSAFTVTATCDGGTATVTGDAGGSFAFNPAPTDGAVIDVATGTVTMGTPGAVYTIEYTTGGPCPDVSTVNLAVLNQDNSSFTLSPTCDGATATITGQAGGTFAFNPVPTDGAMINTTTGTITNAPFDATYTVEYTTNGPCPTTTTQSVTVFSQPTIVPPTPLEVCDDNVPDGFTAIDLTLKNNEVTGNNPAYTVSYHLLQTQAENDTDALPNTYTNISNPQIIYVRVEDSSTGCADTAPLELRVVQAPAANTPMPLEYCDPDADGFGTFDLDSTIPEITGNAAGLTVTFHETQTNAENGVVELSSPYDNIMINTQTIYVRIESATVATDCASFVQLQLIVYPTPQILDTPTTIEICDNAT
ncbi:PKD domain-containing protein, partial [Aurantibacter aestuarii]